MKFQANKGIGAVEVIIAAAIITSGILSLIASYTIYVNYALSNNGNVQAAYLAEEGLEVMTFFRDKGWTSTIEPLPLATTYYLIFSGTGWATTTTPQYVDGKFLRTITLANVQRDGSGKIVAAGGTNDSNTRQVTVTVEYPQGSQGTTTRSMTTYLSNINGD